jgi:glycosyltransferase involved in cell wall biosynthesis
MKKPLKIALIRGNSLNEWEGCLWNNLGDEYEITGFCTKANAYPIHQLAFPVVRLASSADSRLSRALDMRLWGKIQPMHQLENHLAHYDIAHTAELQNTYTLQAVRAKSNNQRLKVVCTAWDNTPRRFDRVFRKKKIARNIKEACAGIDRALAVTEKSREALIAYGMPPEKITILTPGILRAISAPRASDLRSASGSSYTLCVARLVQEKGVYDILEAWRLYRAQSHNPVERLIFVGDGPERAGLERGIRARGLDNAVIIAGTLPHEKTTELYAGAACLILASKPTPVWEEQFGYALAEAIVAECPIIASRSGAIPEVVGGAGILCEPGNPAAFCAALLALDAPETRRALRAAAHAEKEKFDAERFRAKLRAIYESL